MFLKNNPNLSKKEITKLELVPEEISIDAYLLLDSLLDPNYKTRITAINSLNHPFFSHFKKK